MAALGAASLASGSPDGLAVTAVIGLGAALGGAQRLAVRRRSARFLDAYRRDDAETARRLWNAAIARVDERGRSHPRVRVWEAALQALEDRWDEAFATASAIDARALSGNERLALTGLRAGCLAQLGRADEAIDLLQQALGARALPSTTRGSLLRTLAVARLRAGRHEAALRACDEAAALSGSPVHAAALAFCRAEALRGLGREGEARAAYAEAQQRAPGSRFARRAAARLAAAPPSSYR